MTIKEYQDSVRSTYKSINDKYPKFLDATMKLDIYSGQATSLLNGSLFENEKFRKDEMIGYLGEIAFYLAVAANSLGIDLETVMNKGIDNHKETI